ncbi:MAG: hypothetical protein ACQBVK_05375 [Candidatus Phytoplasma sp. TWB_XP]
MKKLSNRLQKPLDHPEMFAEAIEHGYVFPTVAKKNVRGSTKIGAIEYLWQLRPC